MNKKIIIAILAFVLLIIITGISIIVTKNQGEQFANGNQFTNISEDTFMGTIISNDGRQISVVPNKEELIRQSSFEIINAVITQNTILLNGEVKLAVDDVTVGDIVKVTFDGKIYEVKPGKVMAQKVEVIEHKVIEE